MTKKDAVQLFEDRKVRTIWDDEREQWYFSVIDTVGILTDSLDPKRYWSVLKSRLKKEGCEPTTICSTLKMVAPDGKMRLTDVATQEQLFRLIQSKPPQRIFQRLLTPQPLMNILALLKKVVLLPGTLVCS